MSHIYHRNIDIIMKKGLNYKTYLRLVITLKTHHVKSYSSHIKEMIEVFLNFITIQKIDMILTRGGEL